MNYLYSISIGLSFISLMLLIMRVILNKKNIKFNRKKYNWKVVITLVVISIIPIINLFLMLTNTYISILMNKNKFIEFMNE